MNKKLRKRQPHGITLGIRSNRVEDGPPAPPAPPPPPPIDDAVARARYEADTARAEAERLRKQNEQLQANAMTEEQKARLAELEAKDRAAEEERMKKAGEFDAWRAQTNERHNREMEEERVKTAAAQAEREKAEKDHDDTLIGLAFSGATEWFGKTGKTVLMPDIAKAYFGTNVVVQTLQVNGRPTKRAVVKDLHGTVIIDTKTAQPAEFSAAIGELIAQHPYKNDILRGSGKVGSGSPGGGNAGDNIDLGKLRSSDFANKDVRDKVRDSLAAPGGLKIGPGFDAMRKQTKT